MAAPLLPLDVVLLILKLLPVKQILQCKIVCKNWYNLIKDPSFVQYLSQCQSILYTTSYKDRTHLCYVDGIESPSAPTKFTWPSSVKFDLVGSCNGLVCIRDCSMLSLGFAIVDACRRSLKEIRCLPPTMSYAFSSGYVSVCDFGYDPRCDDYKVVVIYNQDDMSIYSTKAGSWKKIKRVRYAIIKSGQSKVTNNYLHCIVESNMSTIARFDLSSEKWDLELRTPVYPRDMVVEIVEIGLLNECLTLRIHGDIWVMKEYGVEKSWTKLFSLSNKEYTPVAFSITGCNKVLFFCSDGRLYWYDEEEKTTKEFVLNPKPSNRKLIICDQRFGGARGVDGEANDCRD